MLLSFRRAERGCLRFVADSKRLPILINADMNETELCDLQVFILEIA